MLGYRKFKETNTTLTLTLTNKETFGLSNLRTIEQPPNFQADLEMYSVDNQWWINDTSLQEIWNELT